MNKSVVLGTSLFLGTMAFNPAVMPDAQADIVGTSEVVAEQQSGWDRAQLIEQLQRDEMREQLVQYGVDPDEAVERVAALTDEEVMQLTAQLGELPAGAGISVSVSVILVGLLIWLIFFR